MPANNHEFTVRVGPWYLAIRNTSKVGATREIPPGQELFMYLTERERIQLAHELLASVPAPSKSRVVSYAPVPPPRPTSPITASRASAVPGKGRR